MKMKLYYSFIAVCTVGMCMSANAASVYPSTYPFDKEAYKPPSLPVTKPFDNKNYADKANPGGYLVRSATCDPYADDRLAYSVPENAATLPRPDWKTIKPPGFRECRIQAYDQWVKKGNPGDLQTNNCTAMIASAGAATSEASFFPDSIGGKKVCESASCCDFMKGQLLYKPTRAKNTYKHFGNLQQTGLCKNVLQETSACAMAAFPSTCIEYFTGGKTKNTRSVMPPCHDSTVLWLLTCPIFKASSTALSELSTTLSKWETQTYRDLLSAEQMIALYPLFKLPDRVCHPYSYYFPNTAKGPGSDSSSGSSKSYIQAIYAGVSVLSITFA